MISGIILYIMLTGIHPFDLTGRASDADVAATICKREPPPLRNSPITAHLSDSGKVTRYDRFIMSHVLNKSY